MDSSAIDKKVIDVTLRKIFDMKMKQGHEMKKAHADEVRIRGNNKLKN
jgi:hypothetical protein